MSEAGPKRLGNHVLAEEPTDHLKGWPRLTFTTGLAERQHRILGMEATVRTEGPEALVAWIRDHIGIGPSRLELSQTSPIDPQLGTPKLLPVNKSLAQRGSPAMDDRWLSVEEIAEYIGVAKDTVYTWAMSKRMPGHKVGRLWKFKRAEIDAWVREGGAAEKREQADA